MVRNLLAPFVLAVGLAATAACGSPSAPASTLPFGEGTYRFTLSGGDFVGISSGTLVPGCPGRASAGLSLTVSTEVQLTRDGTSWIGRPKQTASGVFELRFTEGSLGTGAPGGGPGIGGTASGIVINTLAAISVPETIADIRAQFGADARFSGGVSRDGFVGSGILLGTVVLSNSQGASTTCNADTVSWSVSRVG